MQHFQQCAVGNASRSHQLGQVTSTLEVAVGPTSALAYQPARVDQTLLRNGRTGGVPHPYAKQVQSQPEFEILDETLGPRLLTQPVQHAQSRELAIATKADRAEGVAKHLAGVGDAAELD